MKDCSRCGTKLTLGGAEEICPECLVRFQSGRPDSHAPAVEGTDYYFENGFMVFTELYHRNRGYCCESGCRHCPYRK